MKPEPDEPESNFEDQIKPEDGLLRHWMFINGEQYRLFAALAAASFGVLWGFLSVLGVAESVALAALVLSGLSFIAWRLLDRQFREYEEKGWEKVNPSPRRERIEIRVALALWLFILISIGVIMFLQWRHGK